MTMKSKILNFMKKRKKTSLVGLAIPLVLGITYSVLHKNQDGNKDLQTVIRKPISKNLFLNGKVRPIRSITVLPAKSGTISDIFVREGEEVKEGTPLYTVKLEIDSEEELLAKRAKVRQLDIDVAERTRRLKAKSPIRDLIATESLIQDEAELDRLKIDLKVAKDALAIAEKEMGLGSKSNPGRSNIIQVQSPIAGIVTLIDKRRGEYVASGATLSNSGSESRVVVVADLATMSVQAKVTETDLRYIQKGQTVSMTVDAYPDLKLAGTITRIGGQGKSENSGSTFFDIEAIIENSPGKVLPEMTAYLEVVIASKADAVVVPANAVIVLPQQSYVHLPDKSDSRGYKEVPIKTGIVSPDYVEVLEGLKVDDKVMTIDLAKTDLSKVGQNNTAEKGKQDKKI